MRVVIIITIILTISSQSSFAQNALISTFPKVDVKVELLKYRYKNFDSIQFVMTLTYMSDTIQSLLFDRPSKSYPWGTFVILTNKNGDTISANVNRETLSSTLYIETELKERGAFYNLKQHQSLKQTYMLAEVVILRNHERRLSKGQYNFSLSYYGNQSNQVTFEMEQ